MKKIYLDHASTTPVDPEVLQAMMPFFTSEFGNPSSITEAGVKSKKAIEGARKSVSSLLRALPDEIIFTSGGTESNNLAILGLVKNLEANGLSISKMHFVTTNIEHSSVLETMCELKKRGAKVDFVPVESNGIVDPQKIKKALKSNTVLVSVMYANNEIGTIQPIQEISKTLRHFKKLKAKSWKLEAVKNWSPIFHTDASQAPLYLDMNVQKLGVDLLTLDAHKMYGPKGVGALYVRRGIRLSPIILGGGQEGGLRSTTENVAGIVGLAKAFEIADSLRDKESLRLAKLRDNFLSLIRANGGTDGKFKIILNGDLENRLPNNLNISIPGIDSEFLILQLDAKGISASTKSSCLRDEEESYVIKALGGDKDRAKTVIRFSLGRENQEKYLKEVVSILTEILKAQK